MREYSSVCTLKICRSMLQVHFPSLRFSICDFRPIPIQILHNSNFFLIQWARPLNTVYQNANISSLIIRKRLSKSHDFLVAVSTGWTLKVSEAFMWNNFPTASTQVITLKRAANISFLVNKIGNFTHEWFQKKNYFQLFFFFDLKIVIIIDFRSNVY